MKNKSMHERTKRTVQEENRITKKIFASIPNKQASFSVFIYYYTFLNDRRTANEINFTQSQRQKLN